MTRKIFIAFSLATLLACFGCGAKNSEKVQGVWRTTEKQGPVHGFIEIRADKLIKDGDDAIDIALDDKDDKVSVRVAGTDQVIAVVTVVDDNTIEFAFQGMFGSKTKLVKSSTEEMNAAFNPPLDRITGFWKSEKDEDGTGVHSILEIGSNEIAFDGESVPASISTKKGAYIVTAVQGDGLWELVPLDDGKLHLGARMSFGRTYVRSTPEEAAAIAAARSALIEKFHGFWKEVEARHDEPFAYIEIAPNMVDINGERHEADISQERGGAKLTRRDNGDKLLTASLDENGHLKVTRGIFGYREYERSNREELEKINNPKFEHVAGFWLLDDPEKTSYLTVELAPDYIVRDRRREETKAAEGRTRFAIAIARREPKEMHWFNVSRIDDDHILLSYDNYGEHQYRYRRAGKDEYEQAVAGMTNPLDIVVGHWRSAEPVEDTRGNREVHATAVFAANVEGEKGRPVDWCNTSFFSSSGGLRNRSWGAGAVAREGVWVYFNGDISRPFELMRVDGGVGTWVQVKIIDADTLDIATDGREFVRCVRSNQEEVIRLRAAIK